MNTTKDSGLIEAKTRLTNIKADTAALKLELLRHESVGLSEVNKQWGEQAGRVRTKLLALPVRIAGLLGGKEYAPQEIESLVSGIVNEALSELASEFIVPEEE